MVCHMYGPKAYLIEGRGYICRTTVQASISSLKYSSSLIIAKFEQPPYANTSSLICACHTMRAPLTVQCGLDTHCAPLQPMQFQDAWDGSFFGHYCRRWLFRLWYWHFNLQGAQAGGW